MIIIKSITKSKPFMYFWLKSVDDVNLSQHCAKCLVGEYSNRVNASQKHVENITLENGVYYLCGVSKPYNWNNNFHLAFKYSEGETIIYSSNGVDVIIENAVALPISPDYIDPEDINAHKKAYSTCRNWQFAHYFKKHLL